MRGATLHELGHAFDAALAGFGPARNQYGEYVGFFSRQSSEYQAAFDAGFNRLTPQQQAAYLGLTEEDTRYYTRLSRDERDIYTSLIAPHTGSEVFATIFSDIMQGRDTQSSQVFRDFPEARQFVGRLLAAILDPLVQPQGESPGHFHPL